MLATCDYAVIMRCCTEWAVTYPTVMKMAARTKLSDKWLPNIVKEGIKYEWEYFIMLTEEMASDLDAIKREIHAIHETLLDPPWTNMNMSQYLAEEVHNAIGEAINPADTSTHDGFKALKRMVVSCLDSQKEPFSKMSVSRVIHRQEVKDSHENETFEFTRGLISSTECVPPEAAQDALRLQLSLNFVSLTMNKQEMKKANESSELQDEIMNYDPMA